jgi:hypothetical protein
MAIQIRGQLRVQLRRRYQRLRELPGQRWNTIEGQIFLTELREHVARYGQMQIASALGISHQGVAAMLRRHDQSQVGGIAITTTTLIALSDVYDHVQKWRGLGRQVRRHYESYRLMHDALETLTMVYPVPTIARMSGIRAQELSRFMDEPKPTTFDDVALLALLEEYDDGRAFEGPRRRAFLTQLEETLASHRLVDVAHVLRVPAHAVRTWMVDKTHGQRSEGTEDP